MGCDIHLFVERQNKKTGAWEFVSPPQNGTKFIDGKLLEGEVDYRFDWTDESGLDDRTWFDDRNYTLFGYLAGVRSCPTDIPFAEAVAQQGMPDDLSAPMRYIVEEDWKHDGHSHFWGTLGQLLTFFQLACRDASEETLASLANFNRLLAELSTLTDDERRLRVVAFFDN